MLSLLRGPIKTIPPELCINEKGTSVDRSRWIHYRAFAYRIKIGSSASWSAINSRTCWTRSDSKVYMTPWWKHSECVPELLNMQQCFVLTFPDPPGQPYIEGYSEGETLHRGQEVELICKSRGGNPPARIEWFRNNEKVTSIYRTESSVSASSYTFTAQATDDKSRYTCKVSNSMTVSPMLTHVDLRVLCKYT